MDIFQKIPNPIKSQIGQIVIKIVTIKGFRSYGDLKSWKSDTHIRARVHTHTPTHRHTSTHTSTHTQTHIQTPAENLISQRFKGVDLYRWKKINWKFRNFLWGNYWIFLFQILTVFYSYLVVINFFFYKTINNNLFMRDWSWTTFSFLLYCDGCSVRCILLTHIRKISWL